MSRFLLLTLVLSLFAFNSRAFADPVNGIILSHLGVPVAGATVEVQGSGMTATSSATGSFALNLPAGSYNIQIIPPVTLDVAPLILTGVVVNGTTSLGTLSFNLGALVTGSVTDNLGTPVVNGDLDVFDQATGIKLSTENDKTTVTGSFSIRVPTGDLRIRAEPSVGQVLVAQSVLVTVTANQSLPTIALVQGFLLTGSVVDSSNGLPIVDVDLDVDDPFTNTRIDTPGDNTDILGNFSVIVPTGLFLVSFEAPANGTPYVAERIEVSVNGVATNIGSVSLNPGVELTGTVVDNIGFPVADVDLDVRMLAGDDNLFVPSDETAPDGSFRIVIPSGSHRIVFQPSKTTLLQSQSTVFTNFVASTNLGTITLQSGVLLSGQVTAFGSVPQQDCRIVVSDATNGMLIETADNLTDAMGNYSVVVPTGIFDVEFRTRKASIVRDIVSMSVAVTGPTTLDASLSLLPMLVYADDPAFPGPQVVLPGSPQIFATIAIYNPNGITTGAFLDAEIEEPFGTIIPLLTGSPIVLGAQQFILAQFTPIPLPAVLPANVGLPHKFRLRLVDPIDGSVIDVDEFTYFPL